MNEKNKFFLLTIFLLASSFAHEASSQVVGVWSGTVSMTIMSETIITTGETRISTSFTENKGYGTINWEGVFKIDGRKGNCNGSGPAELQNVVIYPNDSTYEIYVIGPECSSGSSPNSNHQNDMHIADEKWNGDPNRLSGTKKMVISIDGTGGTGTITFTWSLYKGPINAELIVTPHAYNTWMPIASPDELKKGTVMDIGLKVQGKNGGNPSLKAVRFELRLSNTSREKGTTLNTPLIPSTDQLPDLRFLQHRIGESMEEDQYMEVTCEDGKTGTATIASYDGGGWTTLTAVAVLEGGLRIEGMLLRPGGVKEIPIPKRDPTSHIATAWLAANANPGEKDDKEKRTGNLNIGDGLTAYEEYRGVISQGQFLRLKATEKELGVMVKRSEVPLFDGGISWFENACDIKVIRFDETEIGTDRRLNNNFGLAHDYKQYVLKLDTGSLPGSQVGRNEPTNIIRGVPKKSDRIVIDVTKIREGYQYDTAAARIGNEIVPYTFAERLANTIAHEMGHGINLVHHGDIAGPPDRVAPKCDPPPCNIIYRIYDHHNKEIPDRPITLENAGAVGAEESGDLACIMAYTGMYQWAYRVVQGELIYYYVTFLPVGRKLCTSKVCSYPKCINANNKYFGNASTGNCASQIKFRD